MTPNPNELLHSLQFPCALGSWLLFFPDESMGPISKLSRATQWRATTATGETEVFHLKIIADDWAGIGGTVEAVTAAAQKLSTESVGNLVSK